LGGHFAASDELSHESLRESLFVNDRTNVTYVRTVRLGAITFDATMMSCRRRLLAISCLAISLYVYPIESFSHQNTFHGKGLSKLLGAKPSQALEDVVDINTHVIMNSPSPVSVDSMNRRQVLLSSISSALIVSQFPQVSHAGEVGARITKAVTTSDLGISVRESVVRGAQTMDKIDGQWEQFSDKFGLGAARKQQAGKPEPKVIPDPLPLDKELAKHIIETSDQVRAVAVFLAARQLYLSSYIATHLTFFL